MGVGQKPTFLFPTFNEISLHLVICLEFAVWLAEYMQIFDSNETNKRCRPMQQAYRFQAPKIRLFQERSPRFTEHPWLILTRR